MYVYIYIYVYIYTDISQNWVSLIWLLSNMVNIPNLVLK